MGGKNKRSNLRPRTNRSNFQKERFGHDQKGKNTVSPSDIFVSEKGEILTLPPHAWEGQCTQGPREVHSTCEWPPPRAARDTFARFLFQEEYAIRGQGSEQHRAGEPI